jgi:hypothetical protein
VDVARQWKSKKKEWRRAYVGAGRRQDNPRKGDGVQTADLHAER